MNILAIHNYYRIAGGEDSCFDNETALLRENGENVITYTKHNKDMIIGELFSEAVYSDKSYEDVRDLIKYNSIDIVHVHNDRFLISPSVYLAAYHEKVPVVRTLHNYRMLCINAMLARDGEVCRECIEGGHISQAPAMKHRCYRNSRILTHLNLRIERFAQKHDLYKGVKYIALTDFNRDIFVSAGFDRDSIFVKPNFSYGFDGAINADNERSGFLYLGRLDKLKGIEDILNEWAKVPENIMLYVAGTGERKYVRSLKKSCQLKNVKFLGQLKPQDAMDALKKVKALIFASKWYEGFPMTIIESFSKGTPVIGTDFGNAGNILKGIYGSDKPLLKDIGGLSSRVTSFDRDRSNGLYYFDRDKMTDYTPKGNYRLLKEIYENCLKSS